MRSPRNLLQLATAVALVGALSSLAACGSDDAGTDTGTTAPTGNSTASAPAGGDETGTASGGLVDICTKITAAEISDILGGPVTSETVPGGGCNFSNEDDPRATSVQLVSSVVDEGAGGFAGSVSGLNAVLPGSAGGPVDGVGDEAYAKTGSLAGSELVRGSGLVRVGTNLVQVDLSPDSRKNLSATDVQAIVVDTLNLVAPKL
ncbi:MAG: hypothetical protein JWQ74_36 [Marmoricola sp.]|nr:hypothetical protein [Marmoricola sp.]